MIKWKALSNIHSETNGQHPATALHLKQQTSRDAWSDYQKAVPGTENYLKNRIYSICCPKNKKVSFDVAAEVKMKTKQTQNTLIQWNT